MSIIGRIYMRVTIQNDSNTTLRWRTDERVHGSWTAKWWPSNGVAVPPGAATAWQIESKLAAGLATTDAEARVWYRVDGAPGELYVHVDSPLIESQYANTFHVWAPSGYEAACRGGQKDSHNRAELRIRFRKSARRAVPNFTPRDNGLHFSNTAWSKRLPVITLGRLWNDLLPGLGAAAQLLGIGATDDDSLPITRASQGMCGGMVFAVMDYFHAGLLPPANTMPPASSSDVLFKFIRERLIESFDITGSGYRWLAYSSPLYPDGDEGVLQTAGLARGRAWVSYRDEWPRIRDDIDAGRLAPIGLVQTNSLSIGDNHQVLGYAYLQSGQNVTIWIYDPNLPDRDDLTLGFDITDTTGAVHITRGGYASDKCIYALLHMDGYQPRQAPRGRVPLPKRAVTLHAETPDYEVVSGTSERAGKTPCGDAMEWGRWIVITRCRFSANIAPPPRADEPRAVVAWSVAGQRLDGTAGTVQARIDGRVHAMAYTIDPSTCTLMLVSAAGPAEAYTASVALAVADPDGGRAVNATADFDSAGLIEGWRPGDLAKWGRCIERTIPGRVDWNVFKVPDHRPQARPEQWQAEVIAQVRKISDLAPDVQASLDKLVALQAHPAVAAGKRVLRAPQRRRRSG